MVSMGKTFPIIKNTAKTVKKKKRRLQLTSEFKRKTK